MKLRNYFIRFTSIIIIMLVTTQLLSCTQKKNEPNTTESQPGTSDSEKVPIHTGNPDNEVWAKAYLEALPISDFDGATFLITSPETGTFDPDEIQYLSETIYKRNKMVEDKYNISIRTSKIDTGTMLEESVAAKKADMYFSDIMCVPLKSIGDFELNGLLMNLRSLPYFDMSKKYFNSSSVEALSAGYKTYGIAGEATVSISGLPVVYFNQNLTNELIEPSLYDVALEGKFTWDKFFEYTAIAENNDSISGALYSKGRDTDYIFTSTGGNFISSGYLRVPTVGFTPESTTVTSDIISKLTSMQSDKDADKNSSAETFKNGNTMFIIDSLKKSDLYQSEKYRLGILPMPKINEESEYRSLVSGDTLIFTVASWTTKSELVSLALSGLCAASFGYINEKYADYLMITKLNDSKSAVILDLISKTAIYDLSSAFGSIYPDILAGSVELLRRVTEENDFTGYDTAILAAEIEMERQFPNSN